MVFLSLLLVIQRERWMSKAPEPQAVQKLLHSRTTKSSQAASSTSSAKATQITETTKKLASPENSNKCAKNTEKVLSRYWDDRLKKPQERQRKALITGVLPNKYQPEPVVKKIAFGGMSLLFILIKAASNCFCLFFWKLKGSFINTYFLVKGFQPLLARFYKHKARKIQRRFYIMPF